MNANKENDQAELLCRNCGKPIEKGWEEMKGRPPPWLHIHDGSRYCSELKAEPKP